MAKPPPSPPSSDITGVDRDWSFGKPSKDADHQPAQQIDEAQQGSAATPDGKPPLGEGGDD